MQHICVTTVLKGLSNKIIINVVKQEGRFTLGLHAVQNLHYIKKNASNKSC